MKQAHNAIRLDCVIAWRLSIRMFITWGCQTCAVEIRAQSIAIAAANLFFDMMIIRVVSSF